MLFGNRERIGIEIQALAPSWERRYRPERVGWAAISVWIRGRNLCSHVVRGSDEVRHSVNVPLAPLADWIVRSWAHIQFEERPIVFATSDHLYESLDRWADS